MLELFGHSSGFVGRMRSVFAPFLSIFTCKSTRMAMQIQSNGDAKSVELDCKVSRIAFRSGRNGLCFLCDLWLTD